jgi:hypothetical protein
MFFDTDLVTQASGDRLSPLFSLNRAERALARQRYAEDPTPFDVLIRDSLRLVDHAEQVCAQIAEQAVGRAGA